MLGDSIRSHREQAARRRIESVKEKAKKESIELKPAPVKFIASWCDAASLEADNSDINELWENLLLSALTNYGSYLNIFIDILRRFGGSEAKALQLLISRGGPLDVGAISVPQAVELEQFPKYIEDVVGSGKKHAEIWLDIEECYNKFDETAPAIFGAIFEMNAKSGGSSRAFHYHSDFSKYNLSFEFLRREGLVVFSKVSTDIFMETESGTQIAKLSLLTGRLTQLGISFSAACMGLNRGL